MRTLLVGLDAACERVLAPLVERGSVPTIEHVLGEGVSGRLESQVPPWTASAWPSLYTGTNPGKHGVFGFLNFDGYDHEVVDATHVRQPPLWTLLDHHGSTSVVLNVPVTHPPREFDGALIPGYTAPEDPECHPSGLLTDVRDEVGRYRVYADDEGTDVADADEQLDDLADLARLRGRTFASLADRFDPDFGFLQFQVTDTVCHQFPGDTESIGRVYEAVDAAIERSIETADPDTVVVASDHGIGPYDRRVAPNEALRTAGLVSTTRDGDAMPTWSDTRDRELRSDGPKSVATEALARAGGALARLGLTSQRIGRLVEAVGATDFVLRHAPDELVRAGSERVDFPESEAYVRSRVECGVRINLEGRDPDGVVPPEEYEAVRQRVVETLRGIETERGDPVFETVAPREEFFTGPHAENAVDVVALPRGFESSVTSWITGSVVEPIDGPEWDHKRHGIVAIEGNAVQEGATLSGAHLFDVAPTVLASMGLPMGTHMDGRVLDPVPEAGTTEYPAYEPTAEGGETGDAVERRLSKLGYLE